ncbi:MAG: carboxypeptidase regulatory-like domain-containing protein [Thermoanaerobaculia bacterium]
MLSRTKLLVLLTAIGLLAGLGAYAQTNATLSGTVTTDGTGVPGVSITITSPNLQGTRTTVSGNGGDYYFGALPPGKYSVKFELDGMTTVTKTVDIGVAQSGKADAAMSVAAVAEAITVTAAAPSVLETPQVATNVPQALVDELPIGRTVLDGALLAPGVNNNTAGNTPNTQASQLQISGSPGYDNLVMVNGVVITESVRSQALNLYVEDAIQETTILTGGVSAEYGRFTGGVVNSITKSGGNQFSGSFRDSQTNPHWTDKTNWAGETEPRNTTSDVYEATFGGYVVRDRLWFFAAGRKADVTDPTVFTRVVPGDATRTIFGADPTRSNEKYEVKLTGQITPKHSLVASYYDETADATNQRFTATSYDLEQFSDRSDPKDLTTAFYNGILSTNLLVEARYSEMNYGIGWGSGAKDRDFIKGTIVRNRGDSNARWNSATFCGVCDHETRSNDGWVGKANYYLATSGLGSHNLVGGVESFSEHRFANNYQSGSDFRLFVNGAQRVDGSYTIYPTILPGPGGSATYLIWTPIFDGANESDLKTDSLFVNDKWDLNDQWSFNIGFRYDKNDGQDGSGNTTSDDTYISPRLTAIYDLKGDGRYRFSASYNEYVSRVVDGPATSGSSAGSPAYIYYAYEGPAINPAGTPTNQLVDTHTALQQVYDWFQANGGIPTPDNPNLAHLRANSGHSVPGYDVIISDSLASPHVTEYVLGFGTQIGNNAYVKVDGIMRDWKDFYASRVDQSTPVLTDPLGIQHDVAIIENTNDAKREYRGIQFQSGWRPGRFNVGLNYTWATLKGNDTQEDPNLGTQGNFPGSIYYAEFLDYERRRPEGYLAGDQRHRVRAWVGYDVPMPQAFGSVNLSVLHNYDSGQPYSAFQNILVQGAGTGAPTIDKYVASPGTGTYYFSERGEYRLPDINRTDASINYSFPKIWNVELFAQAELLNVFYNQNVVTVNTSVNASGTSGNFAAFDPFTTDPSSLIECPQGTPGATCLKMGAHWQKGASFGQPTGPASYQVPRTYRFSFGARF